VNVYDTVYRINPQPEDWPHSWPDWVLLDLMEQGAGLEVGEEAEIYASADDLDPIRDMPIQQVVGLDVGNEQLTDLFWALNEYLVLTEIDYVLATLATAVAKVRDDMDPLWLMLVATSSSGKTEAIRLVQPSANGRLSDVSLPGLLANRGSGGILTRLGQGTNSLITISDFSTLLGDTKTSGGIKTDVYNALRDIYDGEFSRDINPTPVSWHGRLSIVAACTPAIDRFSAHADALGTRWLYYRLPERDVEMRGRMAQMATRREHLRERRMGAQAIATEIVEQARQQILGLELPDSLDEVIMDTAVLAAAGRTPVSRDWRREVDDVVNVEEPGRLVGQLRLLALGLLALGVREDVARRVTRHTALSSMPQARARVLGPVAAEPGQSSYAIWKAAGLHQLVGERALEDWEAIGVLRAVAGSEGERPTRLWYVTDDYAPLVASAGVSGSC
jgi:hypothetical protein